MGYGRLIMAISNTLGGFSSYSTPDTTSMDDLTELERKKKEVNNVTLKDSKETENDEEREVRVDDRPVYQKKLNK